MGPVAFVEATADRGRAFIAPFALAAGELLLSELPIVPWPDRERARDPWAGVRALLRLGSWPIGAGDEIGTYKFMMPVIQISEGSQPGHCTKRT
jgi:hypothetical protein